MRDARLKPEVSAATGGGWPSRRVGGPTPRPVRVLHILDSLGGGGCERAVWDLLRLADPARVRSRVVTVCSENAGFVMAPAFSRTGLYSGRVQRLTGGPWHTRLLDAMPLRGKHLLWSRLGPYEGSERMANACGRLALEYLRFRPDIIHGHVWYGLRAGAWLKAWTGTPLVYSVWNAIAQLHDEGAGWVVDDYRRLHDAADAVFVEPTCRPALLGLGFADERIRTFIGGIDFETRVDPALARAARSRLEVRQRLGIPAGSAVALSVGRLTPAKGHRYALEALPDMLRQTPSLHWILLGEGEEAASLRERAAALRLSDRVHMVGYVDDPCPYYAAADVFLRTFLLEGENRATYDAMAFGLPIVGFDTGHPTDRLPSVRNGLLVPQGDTTALATAAAALLNAPDRGRAAGRRGQLDARQHLDVRGAVNLFASTYEALRDVTPPLVHAEPVRRAA